MPQTMRCRLQFHQHAGSAAVSVRELIWVPIQRVKVQIIVIQMGQNYEEVRPQ
jgi:hypothetical protein